MKYSKLLSNIETIQLSKKVVVGETRKYNTLDYIKKYPKRFFPRKDPNSSFDIELPISFESNGICVVIGSYIVPTGKGFGKDKRVGPQVIKVELKSGHRILRKDIKLRINDCSR